MHWLTTGRKPYPAGGKEERRMHPKTIDASPGVLLQFLNWVNERPRNYHETMNAWRTSCPRISVWEDALIDGLVAAERLPAGRQGEVRIVLTQAGRAHLVQSLRRNLPATPEAFAS
jgi:hypothetical protein